jgi:predicted nucleotidyltransferase
MTVEEIPIRKIEEFCKRWKITEFALFGSVLREDFSADSDVDVLVTLGPESHVSLLDWVDMQDELRAVFGREVDLVSRGGLRNPFRRKEILRTRKVIYAESA